MSSRTTKTRRAALRYRVKTWLAVMASNIGILAPGWDEVDDLIRRNPGWVRVVDQYDPNDATLIAFFKRSWR